MICELLCLLYASFIRTKLPMKSDSIASAPAASSVVLPCQPLIAASILFPAELKSLNSEPSCFYPSIPQSSSASFHPLLSLPPPLLLSSCKPAQMLLPGVGCVNAVSRQVRLSDNQHLASTSRSVRTVCRPPSEEVFRSFK